MKLWQWLLGLGLLIGLLFASGYIVVIYQRKSEAEPPLLDKAERTSTPPSALSAEEPIRPTEFSAGSEKLAYNYFTFSQKSYQDALADERPIVLFFSASWCFTCQFQDEIIKGLMNNLDEASLRNVVVFKVDFDDDQTDEEEKKIAEEKSVSIRHTLIFQKRDGSEAIRLFGTTDAAKLTEQLEKLI